MSKLASMGKFLRWFKRYYRFVNVALGILMLFAVVVTGTLALHGVTQRAFNPAFGAEYDGLIPVPLLKLEIDLDGDETENPVPGANFALFRMLDEAPYYEQIILAPGANAWSNGALFTTDADGRIVFNLQLGAYCLRELTPPTGFAPPLDGSTPITEWCFTVRVYEG